MTWGRSIFAHPYRTKWPSCSKTALKPLRQQPPEFCVVNFSSRCLPILYCDFAFLRELLISAIFYHFSELHDPIGRNAFLCSLPRPSWQRQRSFCCHSRSQSGAVSMLIGGHYHILEQFSRNHRILGRIYFFQKFSFEVFHASFFCFFVLNSPRIRGSIFSV